MPKNFKSLKELAKYMNEKALPKAMDGVGEKCKNIVKNRIDEDVYEKYTPVEYDRSYELRNSIISTEPTNNNGTITVEVKHDTNLINATPPNQHMSVVDQSDVSSHLPKWINDGNIGHVFGQGEWTEPRPYRDNTIEQIKQNDIFKKELKKELSKQNIETTD